MFVMVKLYVVVLYLLGVCCAYLVDWSHLDGVEFVIIYRLLLLCLCSGLVL